MWRFLRNRRLLLCLHTIFRALIYWAHRAVVLAIAWHLVFLLKVRNKCRAAATVHGVAVSVVYDQEAIVFFLVVYLTAALKFNSTQSPRVIRQ